MHHHPTPHPQLTRTLHRTVRALSSWVSRGPNQSGGDGPIARPLEPTSSRVGFAIYAGVAPGTSLDDHPVTSGVETVAEFTPALQFPAAPIAVGIDRGGALFDTTEATMRDDGLVIGFRLRLGGLERPYELDHLGGGTYRSRDCELTFEWTDDERFQHLDAILERGETYHVEVQDVVQLYETGGAFDWSVTRTDVYPASADAEPLACLLTVVWDDDGPDNDRETSRVGDPTAPPGGHPGVRLPTDGTPSASGRTIEGTAEALLDGGPVDER